VDQQQGRPFAGSPVGQPPSAKLNHTQIAGDRMASIGIVQNSPDRRIAGRRVDCPPAFVAPRNRRFRRRRVFRRNQRIISRLNFCCIGLFRQAQPLPTARFAPGGGRSRLIGSCLCFVIRRCCSIVFGIIICVSIITFD
jgi:hypothetical protein